MTKRMVGISVLLVTLLCQGSLAQESVEKHDIEQFVSPVLSCLEREEPYYEFRGPSSAFDRCYDYHSAVHAYWALLRVLRLENVGSEVLRKRILHTVRQGLSPENLQLEIHHLQSNLPSTAVRKYTFSWILKLAKEYQLSLPKGEATEVLGELAQFSFRSLSDDLLHMRYRSRLRTAGNHMNTALLLKHMLEWSRFKSLPEAELIKEAFFHYYVRSNFFCYPSDESDMDIFLSPCLTVLDLASDVLSPAEFTRFIGKIDISVPWLEQNLRFRSLFKTDAHGFGLPASRLWALENIWNKQQTLLTNPQWHGMKQIIQQHRNRLFSDLAHWQSDFEVSHWVGQFAIRALTSNIDEQLRTTGSLKK